MNKESWKQIESYPDYLISDNGRICSLKSGLLKPSVNSRGYMLVTLDGDVKRLHRIVATEFIPNPENKSMVNHKDGNPLNNKVDNLEWISNSENQKHANQVLHKSNKRKKVGKFDPENNLIKEYECIRDCERAELMTKDSLRDYIRKGKPFHGFYFKVMG